MRLPSDSPPQEEVIHLTLDGLLPPTEVLAVHFVLRILSRLEHEHHPLHPSHPLMLGEQQFTRREFNVICPLLMKYPDYTPYEMLYASFNYGGYARLTDQAIARARVRLASAQALDTLGIETHPISNTLCRARPRLRALGLDYVHLLETGYVLDRYR